MLISPPRRSRYAAVVTLQSVSFHSAVSWSFSPLVTRHPSLVTRHVSSSLSSLGLFVPSSQWLRRPAPPYQALLTSIKNRFTLFFMTAVTVSSKYQIVIPREARQKLGISSGTRLQAIPEASGLRLVKEPSIDELCGLLRGMPVDDTGIRSERDRTLP